MQAPDPNHARPEPPEQAVNTGFAADAASQMLWTCSGGLHLGPVILQ